jgi:hypothetical protein
MVVAGCGGGSGKNNDNTGTLPCSDGEDNDDDGMTDFPDDLGCGSEDDETEDGAPAPQCDDNRDNDGDGKTDYPHDPGCFAKQADDESDDCPSGPGCAQCSNGKDDDGNGMKDFPQDMGCESAADNSEFFNNAVACGQGMKIKQLPPDGVDMGQLEMGSTSDIMSPCGGGAGSFAVAYVLHLTEPKVIVATTDMPGTATDTVIDIRGQACTDPAAEIACSDDISTANDKSKVTKALGAGVYYIIVQGHDSSVTGSYQLKVEKFAGEGTPCTTQAACGPGLFCRTPVGGSQMVCSKPVCSDGLDDDADTKIDYPLDPGCSTPEDDSETDTCPGAGCPECGDGIDNDADTKIDYPMDTTCKAAGDSSESCTTTEGVVLINTAQTMGDTSLATSDINPTCASTNNSGPDRHYRLDLPAMQSLNMNMTASFDTSTVLLNSTCGGTALACSDPLNMTTGALPAGTYYFVVDGYFNTSKGTYTINTAGRIANGGLCDSHPLSQIGAITCGNGYACKGTSGSKTCQPAQCGDGMDNNGNGKTDYPADPGCQSTSDDTETTVCPGASCPVCSNGADDDMDGLTDYPTDTSCIAASGNNESCTSTEAVINVTTATTMGDTGPASDDVKLTCSSSSSTAKDLHHKLALPAMSTLTLSLTGKTPAFWDSAMALFGASCGGTAIGCVDADTLTVTNLAAGNYFFAVDGWSTASGTYTLNVAGTIANGGSCESALAQSGAITCGANYACKGGTGAKTCQLAQCADGVDNNGAGGTDYPSDPGCSSSSDDTEATVCPGALCPVCANGMDDDTDGKTDYPMDFGCAAAGGSTEVFCTGEPDVAMNAITTFATTGDLTSTADNYDQTCQSSTGNDMALALQLPVAVASLVIDTEGSTITDTVVSMKDSSCGTQLGCDDDTGTGNLSKLTVTNVAPGNYAIQVDGYSTSNNGPFTLNVKGTVAPMTSCTSPLFASGVLACPTGTTCTGSPLRCQ